MKNILAIFIWILVFDCVKAQDNFDLVIKRCSTPPLINGIIDNDDPWTDNWIPIDYSRAVNTTSNMNAKFQMLYDDNNLYILVQVNDPTRGDTMTDYSYESDCVEVFLALDTNSGSTGIYKRGDFLIRKTWGKPLPRGLDGEIGGLMDNSNTDGYSTDCSSLKNDPNLKIVEVDGTDSYIQEWQLSWNTLTSNMNPEWDGAEFKFDIQVSDNTTNNSNGRTQEMYWHSNLDYEWYNTLYEGNVYLREPASICMVSVGNDNKNIIIWQKPNNPSPDSFFIYRESLSQTDIYDLIAKVPFSAQSVDTDESSNALIQSNKYKIAAVYNNFITKKCIAHKTMHLNINKGQGNTWNLMWESYEGFEVSSYRIYRGSSLSNMALIGSTSGSSTSYSDLLAPDGDIYYQIEVVAPYSCNTLKSAEYSSSRSNIATNSTNSISSIIDKNYINIYPVPVKDVLNFKSNLIGTYDIAVLSIYGRSIMSIRLKEGENSLDVTSLSKGFYFLKLNDNNRTIIGKFIKE